MRRPIRCGADLEDAISRGDFEPPPPYKDLFGELVVQEPRFAGVPRRVLERYFGGLTAEGRRLVLAYFPACVLCGATSDPTLDHVRPLINGHPLIPGNVVRLCRPCNSWKGDLSPERLPVDESYRILDAAAAFGAYYRSRDLPFFQDDHLLD